MHTVLVNGVHLAAALVGFTLIWFFGRTPHLRGLLWPFTIAFGLIVALYLFYWTPPVPIFNDFRRCYWKAGEAIWHGPAALAATYVPEKLVFVNIPIVAYVFAPFGLLPAFPAALAHLAIGIALTVWIWRALVKLFALGDAESALLFFAFCAFGPLLYTYREGNTSHHILALLLGAMIFLRSGKDLSAGVLYGVAAVIKPALLLIGIYFLLRARWRVVLGGTGVCVGAALASLAIFGWDMHVLWYETGVGPYAAGAVPAYANQTIAAVIKRFEIGGPASLDWSPHPLTGPGKLASWAMIAALLAGAGFAAWRSGRLFKPTAADIEIEVMLVVAFAIVASALSWSHYCVWLAPAFVLLWTRTRPGAKDHRLRWALIGVYALTAPVAFLSEQMVAGKWGPLSNLVASHALAGALATFALLAWMRAGSREA